MKKQSLVRLLIVTLIISAAFFMVSASRASHTLNSKEDCTADKNCDQNTQTEFFLQSLTRSLLSK